MYGWAGKILRVDLNKRKVKKQAMRKAWVLNFLGGAGLNAKILYEETPPGIDPFDPENRLIFGAGPLIGTLAPSGCRYEITAKGPFTFAFCDSNSGGHFGPELKFAGYDHIIFQGVAKDPLYLWIDDDSVELRDADHLWGKDVWETDRIIKEELGDPDIKVAAVGVPAEKLVRSAVIINDGARAAGWGGMGAVMGSKRVKAIAVRGTKGVQVAKPGKFEEIAEKCREMINKSPKPKTIGYYGKPWLNWLRNEIQKSNPTMNYKLPRVPPSEFPKVGLEAFEKLIVKWKSCFNCPLHCGHVLKVRSGKYRGLEGEGYEYNQMIDGQMMGIYDLGFVLKWTVETNRLGMDCDDPAYAIAWAMELYERGLITKEDTGGIELTWGNQEAALQMLEKIAHREGFGDILAEGVPLAAKKIGKGSEKLVYFIKGARLEIDPRTGWATALSHAVSTRGADHLKGMPLSNAFGAWKGIPYDFTDDSATDHKAEAVIFTEHLNAVIDSIGMCKNETWSQSAECPGLNEFAELLTTATGHNFTVAKLLEIGERIYNVERAYNAREGLTRKDDVLPEKFYKEPIESKMKVVDRETFEKLKDEYYTLRGWDLKTGNPTRNKLEALGLGYIADDLEKLGKLPPARM